MSHSPASHPPLTNNANNNSNSHSNSSPYQLAHILSTVVADNETLAKDLAETRARCERAEQALALIKTSGASLTAIDNASSPPYDPEAAVKTILELQSRLDTEKAAREAAESRLSESWLDFDRYLQASEVHVLDARSHFSQMPRNTSTKPSFNPLPAYQPCCSHPTTLRASVTASHNFMVPSASLPTRVRHRDDSVEEAPPAKRMRKDRGTSQEELEPYITPVAPEPERDNESSMIADPIDTTSNALERMVFVEPPANLDRPDPTQTLMEPLVTANEQDPIPVRAEPSGKDKQNVNNPTNSISHRPEPAAAVRVEQAIAVSAGQRSRQLGPSLGHWSSTLFEIKQKIEPLASDTLQRLPQLDQREPVGLVTQRRVALRLLMYCASLPTAEFASPDGFLGHPTSVPYYPTGDLESDRNVAFTAALDCLDELTVLLTGDARAEIAGALSELAQALNDLGLHDYASKVSGFALETYRDLYAAEPDQFRSRTASVLSLRADILVDLRQNDDAAGAAEEAVTILREQGDTQPELVYPMLNYAILLGAIGRGEAAAALAFELMGLIDELTTLQGVIILVSPLCQLCVSTACAEIDSDTALAMADKAIEASRTSPDASSKVVLAGALLAKSKILSSNGQNDIACSLSTEAVTLFRSASRDRHVFSLLLAHALFTNSHQLSEANRKGESYMTIHETVEIWQMVQISSPVASKRPLAWALLELAKYRQRGADKQKLRKELEIVETAVSTFREVSPLDYAGLAEALYLYADRMLELDKNRDAATYAEESVQYFREAREDSPQKYALDLIFSLSLASSCLACTERSVDARMYAKQAVEVQHERKGDEDQQYRNHLRKLLMDVICRYTEMGMQPDAMPFIQELLQLGAPEVNGTGQLARRGGKPKTEEFKKQTSYWMDASTSAPKSTNGSSSSAGIRTATLTATPTPALDKGKGKEVTPYEGSRSPTPRVDKGKATEVTPANPFSPSSNARRMSLTEEILSPEAAAAAQRRRDALMGTGVPQGGPFSSGNNTDLLSSLLSGMSGGRTLGGTSGPTRPNNNNELLSRLLGGMGGTGGHNQAPRPPSSPLPMGPSGRPLGSPISQTARAPSPQTGRADRMSGMAGLASLLGGLGGGLGGSGLDPGMFGPDFFGPGDDKDKAEEGNTGTGTVGDGDDTPRSGTWSGLGIQSKLSDDGA